MHPTANSHVLKSMRDSHSYDPSAVHRDMERIFENFDRSRHWQESETNICSPGRRSKPFEVAGRKLARIAPIFVGSCFAAILGYSVAAYAGGHHSINTKYGGRAVATTAAMVSQKPPLADFALLMDTHGSKAHHAEDHLAPQRQRRRIDHDRFGDTAKTPPRVEADGAAERLRREYAEDAAITRWLNAEALDTVVRSAAASQRPTIPSTPPTPGDG